MFLILIAGCGSDPLINDVPDTPDSPTPSATDEAGRGADARGADSGYIVEKVTDQYSKKAERTIELDCPERIVLEVGATMTCRALDVDDGRTHVADIEVTIVDATSGAFEWVATPV